MGIWENLLRPYTLSEEDSLAMRLRVKVVITPMHPLM